MAERTARAGARPELAGRRLHDDGKVALIPVVGILLGLLALYATPPRSADRLERWGLRMALIGNVVALVGLIVEYVVEQLEVGFAISGPGLLLLIVGSTLFGIAKLRAHMASRAGTWLLALSIPLALACLLLIGHVSAALIPLYLAWILIGWRLWSLAPSSTGGIPSG